MEVPGQERSASSRLVATLPWLPLAWATVVLALLVAMDQVSRLAANVLDAQGNAWSLAELMGPSAWASRAGWSADFGGDPLRRSCLVVYVLLDLGLVGAYVGAAVWYARRRFRGPGRRLVLGLAVGVAALDLAEDALALLVARRTAVGTGLADTLARLSMVQSALGLVLVVTLAWGWLTRRRGLVRERAGRAYEAVRQHRLSIIPVLVLGLLLVAPGADILDQVPDVVRRWADGPRNFFLEGGLGVVALLVLAAALLLLGRARTSLACRRPAPELGTPASDAAPVPEPGPGPRGRPVLWLVPPAVVLVVALVLALSGADVLWDRLVRFCAVPVLVWLTSLGLRRLARRWHERHGTPLWRERAEATWTPDELQRLLVVGDAVALALVALAAVGAVRAMTQVAVLQVFGLLPASPYAVVILVVGAVVVVGWWPLAALALCRLDGAADRGTRVGAVVRWLTPTPGVTEPAMLTRLPAVVLGSSVVTFVGLGVLPGVASRGGVLFVLVLSATALTGLTAGASLVAGRYPAAEVFRAARLRSTPVVTLLLVAVVFAGEIDAGTPIHAVRSAGVAAGAPAGAQRPDLSTTVRAWADAQLARGCARPVDVGGRTVGVLPMVLLASEGGGIRAAYWTVQATRPLADDVCAAHATVLSSGVSGGAVGLAVARYDADPRAVVEAMSNSRALATGLVGLLVRDFTYATTGVPLPLLDRADPTPFVDRAGLIEDVWNASAPAGDGWRDRAFAATGAGPATVQPEVGAVVLNSMSVGNACRVWVSEVALRPATEDVGARGDGKIDCDAADVSGTRSVDLLSAYGAGAATAGARPSPTSSSPGCLPGLRVPTAAMLAARFPYVTPSGRVGPCALPGRTAPPDQLVDGGYLENTGLGTLADTSDTWLPAVQQWNAEHAGTPDGTGRVVVAPVVVYLDNDTGNDQHAPQRDITSEALLPPLAKLRAGSGAVADDATLQRAVDAVAPLRVCGPTDRTCLQALGSLDHAVFRVFPGTRPQVAAPLGWILSASSRRAMDDAVAEQLATSCPSGQTYVPRRPTCRDGAGTLQDLLGLVSRP
ncbi:hypothetical protein [Microlunatus flavus]|uniref:Patatin-like phospholipase n=1 Tax=Microlunatus flavus TaxID=1036181 RepID=A0A1H9J3Q6_9ACTN|nr:hypothetical protein [Microlunatus flavus]SEQ81369.1 hypothetical protein SAMN05421756_10680 [Microlunatus flavus]